jgi:hypothetical protein
MTEAAMPELLDPSPPPATLLDRLPEPPAIRARLSDLAAEADLLRALLRLLEQRECGRHLLRRRRQGVSCGE